MLLLIALYYLWGKRFMSDDGYAYGHIGNLSIARQNKQTGEVERLRMDRVGGPIWIPAHGWEDTFAEGLHERRAQRAKRWQPRFTGAGIQTAGRDAVTGWWDARLNKPGTPT